tara:strand:- start:827 stop:1099 length:273 start_codon:yes stop_codon:yes gene_type:complete
MKERNMPNISVNNDFLTMARVGNLVFLIAAGLFVWGVVDMFNGETEKLFQGAVLFAITSTLQGLAQVLRVLQEHALNLRHWQFLEGKVEE